MPAARPALHDLRQITAVAGKHSNLQARGPAPAELDTFQNLRIAILITGLHVAQILERASSAAGAVQDLRRLTAKGFTPGAATGEAVRVACDWATSAPLALLALALAPSQAVLGLESGGRLPLAAVRAGGRAATEAPSSLATAAAARDGDIPSVRAAAAAAREEGELAERRAFALAVLGELAAGEALGADAAKPADAVRPSSAAAPDEVVGPHPSTASALKTPHGDRPAPPPLQAAVFEWLDGRAVGGAGGGCRQDAGGAGVELGIGSGPVCAERSEQALLVALAADGLFCPAAYQAMLVARVRCCQPPCSDALRALQCLAHPRKHPKSY